MGGQRSEGNGSKGQRVRGQREKGKENLLSYFAPFPLLLALFVAQALDWIEAGGFAGRPYTEENADTDRNGESGNDSPGRN